MESPEYWRTAFAVTGGSYFFEAIALCFAIKPKKAFHILLVSKVLLIFLNLDIQLKDFPQTAFCETGFSFVIFFFSLEHSISFLSLIQTYRLMFPLIVSKEQISTDPPFPDMAPWHRFTGVFESP